MVATPLALFAILAQRPKTQYTLGLVGDGFVVRNGAKRDTVPLAAPEDKPKTVLSFRRDKRWAVWDERGLTTRDGEWSSTDRLEAVPTSPKAQEKAAILETLAAVKAGKRNLAADGLSGARRIGGTVYLLARWDDVDNAPWLEALVAVDLLKPHPKPRLLGAFAGLSLGTGVVDSRLGIESGRIVVAVNAPGAWGFATYDPAKGVFGFSEQGSRLVALDGDRIVEKTVYGILVAGRRQEGRTVPWLELRAKTASFVPGEGPVLVRAGGRLRNAATGAEFRLPRNAAIRRSSSGLLVFWPEDKPRSARLLDFDRLEERARWEKGTRRTGERETVRGCSREAADRAPLRESPDTSVAADQPTFRFYDQADGAGSESPGNRGLHRLPGHKSSEMMIGFGLIPRRFPSISILPVGFRPSALRRFSYQRTRSPRPGEAGRPPRNGVLTE